MHDKAKLAICNANNSLHFYKLMYYACVVSYTHAVFQLTVRFCRFNCPDHLARLACACGLATQRLYSRYIVKHNTTVENHQLSYLSIGFVPSVAVDDPPLDRELRRALTGTGPDRRRNLRTAPVSGDFGRKLYGRVV